MNDPSDANAIPQQLARQFIEADALDAALDVKLAQYEARSRAILPDVVATYDRLVARLQAATAASGAPVVGEELLAFVLPDHAGRLVGLDDLLVRGPLVVSINRGHWCPYCRLELRALARAAAHVTGRGAHIVSIQPETAEYTAPLRQEHQLPFPVLTDIDLGYATSLGLVIWIGTEMIALYRRLGIELPRFQKSDGWCLPVPATFVVGIDRRIKAAYVNPDFRRRMTLEQIDAALQM